MTKRMILRWSTVFALTLPVAPPARADLFGGDLVILGQILQQAIQTVLQLQSILANGEDTLNLLRDVNAGVRSGLDLIRIANPDMNPGVYGDLRNAETVLRLLQDLYGPAPQGMDQELIESQDQSVAEVISMNRNLYDYADQVDRERERILYHATVVSPQGAGKLQGQALGVLIGVMTQLLRTQSQMLKLMAQRMAFETRKEKIATRSFQDNFEGVARGLNGVRFQRSPLPRLRGVR